jgi:putative transposase
VVQPDSSVWVFIAAKQYGKWKTTRKHFTCGAEGGVWEVIFALLTGDSDNQYLMLEPTLVRVHQQATAANVWPARLQVPFG